MRWIPVTALIAIVAMVLPASAQVHRCKDASGNLAYSDQPCSAGQRGGVIEPQRLRAQIIEERMQAAEAHDRKQMRRLSEQEREWAAQSQRALQPLAAPLVRNSTNDWAARKALENAATSASSVANNGSRWDQAAEAQRLQEKREAARRRGPTGFTHCDPGFCYDNQGRAYHKAGPDIMVGPGGSTCSRAGNTWNCN